MRRFPFFEMSNASPRQSNGRRPELRRVVLRRLVLHHARRVGRNAVQPAVVAMDVELVERAVHQPVTVHRRGEEGAPYAVAVALHADFGPLPVVEIAEDVDVVRSGQPFAQPPAVEHLVALPAEIAVAVGVIDERPRRLHDCVHFVHIPLVTVVQLPLCGEQPLVAFDDRKPAGRFFHNRFCVDTNIWKIFLSLSANKKRIIYY